MLIAIVQETVIIQVFQLTALVIRGPATRGESLINNVDRVTIEE